MVCREASRLRWQAAVHRKTWSDYGRGPRRWRLANHSKTGAFLCADDGESTDGFCARRRCGMREARSSSVSIVAELRARALRRGGRAGTHHRVSMLGSDRPLDTKSISLSLARSPCQACRGSRATSRPGEARAAPRDRAGRGARAHHHPLELLKKAPPARDR